MQNQSILYHLQEHILIYIYLRKIFALNCPSKMHRNCRIVESNENTSKLKYNSFSRCLEWHRFAFEILFNVISL